MLKNLKKLNKIALIGVLIIASIFVTGCVEQEVQPSVEVAEPEPEPEPVIFYERSENLRENPAAGWTELLKGNQRFLAGDKAIRDWDGLRTKHAEGQWPFVSVIYCSDSRVAPEVLFDQGMGDVFGIRTAGNSVDGLALGSLEFSVHALGAPLIVVMGHEGCGALHSTVAHQKGTLDLPFAIDKLVYVVEEAIPAVDKAINTTEKTGVELGEHATKLHVTFVAQEIITYAEGIKELIEQNEVMVIGAKSMFDGTINEMFTVTSDNLEDFMATPGCSSGGCACCS